MDIRSGLPSVSSAWQFRCQSRGEGEHGSTRAFIHDHQRLCGYVSAVEPGHRQRQPAAIQFGGASKADGFNLDVVQGSYRKTARRSRMGCPAIAFDLLGWSRWQCARKPRAPAPPTTSPSARPMSPCAPPSATASTGRSACLTAFSDMNPLKAATTRTTPGPTAIVSNPRPIPALLASYRFSDLISASVGMANTVDCAD